MVAGKLGVNEIEAVEGMRPVLDSPVHVHAAVLAGMALNGGRSIDDSKLVPVGGDRELVPRYDRDHGKKRAFRLPAFRAAANVIIRALACDAHLHRILPAPARQRAACKIWRDGSDAVID